jgi:predicted nuclease of predicted toxin-antitoxin system
MSLLLANENVPLQSVRLLRLHGHDILSVTELSPGIRDESVLEIAFIQQRILITFDRDYGELVYVRHLPCPPTIILLRFDPVTPDEAGILLAAFLRNNLSEIYGKFIVLDRDYCRKRPLPLLPVSSGA